MNIAVRIVLVSAAVAVGAWAYISGPSGNVSAAAAVEPAVAASAASAAPVARAPVANRLKERSLARWDGITRGDWIQAFDFVTSEQKRAVPIAQFLAGKDHHKYANPAIERVIQSTDYDGYLAVRVLWTPTHPDLQRVKLEPGQTLTEELHMIESWRWQGDDWYYVRAQRADEFLADHPELKDK